jgi:predicted methyltransferase
MSRYVRIALALGLSAIVVSLTASACGSSTQPSTNPPAATKPTFTASLSPANENPSITNAESTGSGSVTITFNLTKDAAGTVTAATADFAATFTGFPAGTSLTAAHIHTGASTVNGAVLVNTAISAGEITMPTGTGTLNKTGITMTADQANNIMNNPAGFYFNIHTALNPGGVARGQLNRTQ